MVQVVEATQKATRKPLTRAFRADLHEQIRIAATRFVWTMVILNSIEDSGSLLNSRTVKRCLKSCWRPKGGVRANALEPSLPTGLINKDYNSGAEYSQPHCGHMA